MYPHVLFDSGAAYVTLCGVSREGPLDRYAFLDEGGVVNPYFHNGDGVSVSETRIKCQACLRLLPLAKLSMMEL